MRLSRWTHSAYETPEDLAAEARALEPMVEVLHPGADAEIIVVSSKERFDAGLLDSAPACRLVVTTTSGTDHLDLSGLRQRGVAACRLPLARRDAVVEASLGMLIAGLRRTGELRARAARGCWARAELPALGPRSLRDATVGVVGLGVIGQRMAEVLRFMGASVVGADPRGLPAGVRPSTVEQMLEECDALTLMCDLNPSSRDIISAARLTQAREDLVLVNTARGALLDVEAAIARLAQGRLGALGVDVFPVEPYAGLRQVGELPGLWLTPHAAGYHRGLPARVREGLVEVVGAFVEGRELPHRRA